MSAVAGKAVALKECATPEYQKYAKDVIVNAQTLCTALEGEGMRAVSGGTQTHLALIDIRGTGVNGKVADERCGHAGIVLNKNSCNESTSPNLTMLNPSIFICQPYFQDDQISCLTFLLFQKYHLCNLLC